MRLLEYKYFKSWVDVVLSEERHFQCLAGVPGSAQKCTTTVSRTSITLILVKLLSMTKLPKIHRVNMHYDVMDVQKLDFDDEVFDVSIDKSTMDCLFCCTGVQRSYQYDDRSWQTLKPGGLFMTISLHDEDKVLPYIQLDSNGNEFAWKRWMFWYTQSWMETWQREVKTHCVIIAISRQPNY